MIPLNYHHLYYFWTVARSGSIAAATQRLYLSQPALSGQLKQLERSCKARLFERGRKGVSLTYEGRLVFERCERMFSEGDELAALIRNGFKGSSVLRIGVEATVAREVVLRVLDFARATDPECRLVLFAGQTHSLQDRLKQQIHDFIITPEDAPAPLGREFRSRVVARLPVVFVANRALSRKVKRFPADLNKTGLLLRPADNAVRQQVDNLLATAHVIAPVEASSQDVDLLRRLAVEGRGVAGLSSLAVQDDLKAGRLFKVNRVSTGILEPVSFACGPHPRSQPAVRQMIEALMSRFSLV